MIEDLARKGENTFDYQNWEEALKKKAVTSEQVQEIINKNLNRTIDSVLTQQFQDILVEYSLKSVEKLKMQQAFNRYYNRKVGDRSPELMKFSSLVKDMVNKEMDNFEDLSELEKSIRHQLSDEEKSGFLSPIEVSAAILYEILS